MPEITGTTKRESLFRYSVVRGFASDWGVKSAHAAHGCAMHRSWHYLVVFSSFDTLSQVRAVHFAPAQAQARTPG